MKQLIDYVKLYLKEEFKWQYGLFILAFGLLLLYLNFYFPATNRIHYYQRWKDTTALYHFALYAIPFAIAVLAQKLFYPKEELGFIKNYKFWGVLVFGVLLWSLRGGLIYYFNKYAIAGLERSTVELESYYRIIYALLKIGLALVPLIIFWWFADRKEQPLYGMRRGDLNLKPYLVLLALLIPIIVIAAQNPGFLKSYPRSQVIKTLEVLPVIRVQYFQGLNYPGFLKSYPRSQVIKTLEILNPDHRQYFLTYEALYILDFYNIELFFRGFMILAFLKYAGPKIILPTAIFYCCLHFGKPFGEALSSLFGGAILGIITYYSRSIWGGIIIHVGIAATMEIAAYAVMAGQG